MGRVGVEVVGKVIGGMGMDGMEIRVGIEGGDVVDGRSDGRVDRGMDGWGIEWDGWGWGDGEYGDRVGMGGF